MMTNVEDPTEAIFAAMLQIKETKYCNGKEIATINSLLERGANSNIKQSNGRTPLHIACEACLTELAAWLLDHEANIDQQDEYGYTPLHEACWQGRLDMVQLLLQHGADINVKDKGGETVEDMMIIYRSDKKSEMQALFAERRSRGEEYLLK